VEHESKVKSLFQKAAFVHARWRLWCTWKNLADTFCFTIFACKPSY